MKRLSSIAISQPHAALTHGLSSRWTYLARTTPNIKDLIKPLEETIRTIFIPTLTSQNAPNDKERQLLARLGGLGISNPSERSTLHYSTCETIAGPFVSLILDQSDEIGPEVKRDQVRMKSNAQKFRRQIDERTASDLKETLPTNLQKSLTICSEKGTSSWLSALPITEHGFALHKGAFRDALCLRYGWRPPN